MEGALGGMRPSWDSHFMRIAYEVAAMGTCFRRKVGCVLVDGRNVILSTGMNGVPPGWPHCSDYESMRCEGAHAKSGTNLDQCVANHAEINAIIHCQDVGLATTCYTTTSPCVSCVKALLCTGVARIVFAEQYPQPEAMKLWTSHPIYPSGKQRTWELHNDGKTSVLCSSPAKVFGWRPYA